MGGRCIGDTPARAQDRTRRDGGWRGFRMTIHPLFQNAPFGPDEISVLVAGYEVTLKRLGLIHRDDRVTRLVAEKIIELGQRGGAHDPEHLSTLAMREMGF